VSRPEVDEPVEIVRPDPRWAAEFEAEAARLRAALGKDAALEHIGSTAVPGLAAKPIVDVMLGVDELGASQGIVDRLAGIGYEDCEGAADRRYLRRRTGGRFNVQIVEHEGELWRANLLLRDFLRRRPDAARRYTEAKVVAVARSARLLAYSDAKRPALEALLAEARLDSQG
jgi:GrpB-like predicted nucleotidyltransferase (UPF0157 family)